MKAMAALTLLSLSISSFSYSIQRVSEETKREGYAYIENVKKEKGGYSFMRTFQGSPATVGSAKYSGVLDVNGDFCVRVNYITESVYNLATSPNKYITRRLPNGETITEVVPGKQTKEPAIQSLLLIVDRNQDFIKLSEIVKSSEPINSKYCVEVE